MKEEGPLFQYNRGCYKRHTLREVACQDRSYDAPSKKLPEVRREAWKQTLPLSLQKKHVVLRPGKIIQGPCMLPQHSTFLMNCYIH